MPAQASDYQRTLVEAFLVSAVVSKHVPCDVVLARRVLGKAEGVLWWRCAVLRLPGLSSRSRACSR